MNITTHFVDRIFALGYWIGFKLHRRRSPKAVAAEPVRADGQAGTTPHAMNWLSTPIGPARSLEETLRRWDISYGVASVAADDANDAANPTHH